MDHKDLQILRLIDEGTAAQTGVAFFREFVRRLANALDSRYAFASRFDAANTRAHVIALWDGANLQEGMEYPLPGSPCENVLGGDIVAFNSDIANLFPVERKQLEAMGAQSYLAIPLKSMAGRVIGHLAVIDTQTKNWQERDFGILRIFAARCAAELERQSAEQEMQRTNHALARRLELEALVAETSTRFMNTEAEAIDAEIERTLDAIGRFIGSDRGAPWAGTVRPASEPKPSRTRSRSAICPMAWRSRPDRLLATTRPSTRNDSPSSTEPSTSLAV